MASTPVRLLAGEQTLPESTQVDVVLTDMALHDGLPGVNQRMLARGEIGVVRVGSEGIADVALPADPTDRELKLTCLLLVQIVRLRRERRESHRIRRVLSHLALSDPLTGLPNRRAWEDEVVRRLDPSSEDVGAVCLALIDLDHFKQINDELGHLAGDQALQEAAKALTHGVRKNDFVARLGGDEFALLLLNLDRSLAASIVDRVRQAVGRATSISRPLTASAGFAVTSEGAPTNELFSRADEALRRAKTTGRDRTVAADREGGSSECGSH